MTSDTEDAETAAARLEAALERIARSAVPAGIRPNDVRAASELTEDIAHRLDAMIERLRAALDGKNSNGRT